MLPKSNFRLSNTSTVFILNEIYIRHAGNVRPCSPLSLTWFAVVHCYMEEACDLEFFKIEVPLHMDFKDKCDSFTQFGESFHPKHLQEPAAISTLNMKQPRCVETEQGLAVAVVSTFFTALGDFFFLTGPKEKKKEEGMELT